MSTWLIRRLTVAAPGSIPVNPGVYRFRDEHGRVIYVGKAKSLRPRLNSYFQDIAACTRAPSRWCTTAAGVEWTVVATEVEALQLEYSWIKEFDPRFNVRYRDDKSYPCLAVTLDEEFPRLQVMRGAKRKGVRYFGPYSHAWAIRETLDLLLRVFPARTCSAGVFKRAGQVGRPCLLGYIGKCSAPCVGRVDAEEHRQIVDDFCDFMAGKTAPFIRRLEKRDARRPPTDQEYERAARLRDDIEALARALEKQAVVLGDGTDADVIALAEDQLEAAVQVFYVRGGRVRGQRGWVVDKVEDVDARRTSSSSSCCRCTASGETLDDACPARCWCPPARRTADAVSDWLRELPRAAASTCGCRSAATSATCWRPSRATPRSRWRCTRPGGPATSPRAAWRSPRSRRRSASTRRRCASSASTCRNLQGTDVVASMVVFEDGLARKSEYRRFAVKGLAGRGRLGVDPRGGHPAVPALPGRERPRPASWTRRATRPTDVPAGIDPETGRPRSFAYPPNLVVVDGGAPQVGRGAAGARRARHRRRRAVRAGEAARGGVAARRRRTR